MATSVGNVSDKISQLDAARNLVLGDTALYPQIVNGVLPIIGAHAELELRRWGAEFLAETFASPVLPVSQKEQLAPKALQTLQETLAVPERDTAVLKSMVQAVTCLYPLIFRHIIYNPDDTTSWTTMTLIKQDLLRRWDTFPYPVRICCIKLVQRIIHVQTPGLISDPRRPDKNETSLAIVPRGHAVLSLPNLEAEASGLLDRLLAVFQEDPTEPLLVNATLNCLPILIRTRQSISQKIINAVLEFNPWKQVNPSITPTMRVGIKSMERTTKALLVNTMKRNPNHPLTGKMQYHVEKLIQSRPNIFDDSSRKRGLPVEPIDGLDNAKRARLEAQTPPLLKIPPLPSGPISYAQLYTLTEDVGLSSFDVTQLPSDLVVKITVPVLNAIDPSLFSQAVEAIRSRYLTLSEQQSAQRQAAEEEEDEYEPEYQPMDTVQQVADQTAAVAAEVAELQPDLVSLGPFVLPQPPPLTEEEAREIGRSAVLRVFSMLATTEILTQAKAKGQQQLGFSRLAGSTFDRDAWVLMLSRIATRASAGLDGPDVGAAKSGDRLEGRTKLTISDSIRESLYRHVLEDFRSRINVGITWLNEEWYNDRVQMQFAASQRQDASDEDPVVALHYDRWALRLLDGILPYLDSRDLKVLVRFLSEIAEITIPITQRVASLAKDPERVSLCVQTLLYLIMFRPPARDMCLNALRDIYNNYEESRPAAGKILAKWRPSYISEQQQQQQQQPSPPPQPQLAAAVSNGINKEPSILQQQQLEAGTETVTT